IQQWQFENVITDHNIEVRFVPNEYTITTESYGYGTITPGETFVYNPDHTYNLVITPNEGYHISAITINDIPINNFNPAGYTQLLTSISKNCVIKAYFAINAYTITASTGGSGMGTVMPQGTMTFDYGDSVTYTANATEGNYISKVIVDGITTNFTLAQNKTSWSITYPSITSNHNLEVQFTAKKFKVTVSTGINGSITPGTQNNIIAGENRTFTISPNVNYHTLRVIVDGDTLGGLAQYTFVNIVENHTIKADFSQNQYTIYAQSNNASYGTINHAGVYTVNTGANAQYSVNAQEGYYIQSITVDNVSIAIPSFVSSHNFTIPNVQANHNIFVTFAQKQVTITVIPVENAMITPETNTFAYQATPTFTIIPVTGYQVTHVLIDGVQTAVTSDATGMATYQFAALTTPHTFSVMVTPKIYTITVNAGSNGAIQTTGDNNIPFGNSKVYNIIANQGYEIETVEVDHVSMGVINSYSFLNVTNHHTIAATFKRIHCEAPTDLFTSHITLDSAKLHWTSIYSNVFLYYKKVSDAQYGTPISVSNLNSYQLTGLDANTRYVWKVQVTCDENTVDSYESTFTTPLSSGMENISLESIKVYGNRNNVYIVNDHQVRIDEVAIYDIYGKQIYQGKTVNNSEVIQLMVANGNYIVRLTTEHGMCVYKINLAR
ncbi:MAG: T9SS type A sorting domain-containing protein, partial [Bacteroidales bacterium]